MKTGKIENVIYVITNAMYPGYVKIGYAQDLKQRISNLNTGAMTDFQPYAVLEAGKQNADKNIHEIISLLNPILQAKKYAGNGKTKQKEFFRLEPEEAFELLKNIAEIWGKPEKAYKVSADYHRMPDEDKNAEGGSDGNGVENPHPPTHISEKRIKFTDSGEEIPFLTYRNFLTEVSRKCIEIYGIEAFKRVVLNSENKRFHSNKRDAFSDNLQTMKGAEYGTAEITEGLYHLTNYDQTKILRFADSLFEDFPKAKAEIVS